MGFPNNCSISVWCLFEQDLWNEANQFQEEERRRTGRYLAVTVILFIIALGLYHTVSRFASDASALVSAAMIMFLYLLWLWYASQRRKLQLKVHFEPHTLIDLLVLLWTFNFFSFLLSLKGTLPLYRI